MKNRIVIALICLLSLGAENAIAQSFLDRLGKAIEKEVKKEVVRQVNQLKGDKSGKSRSQTQPQSQQQKKAMNAVPTVVEVEDDGIQMTGSIGGFEWVDLGLPSGTLWATCNVGAAHPSQPGSLYAWGETMTKSSYTRENSRHYKKTMKDFSGDKSVDVAAAKWGNGWRMPTKTDFQELVECCDWEWTNLGRMTGCKVISRVNGNYIFLSASGVIHPNQLYPYPDSLNESAWYWASTPSNDEHYIYADAFLISKNFAGTSVQDRRNGFVIRPVTE